QKIEIDTKGRPLTVLQRPLMSHLGPHVFVGPQLAIDAFAPSKRAPIVFDFAVYVVVTIDSDTQCFGERMLCCGCLARVCEEIVCGIDNDLLGVHSVVGRDLWLRGCWFSRPAGPRARAPHQSTQHTMTDA